MVLEQKDHTDKERLQQTDLVSSVGTLKETSKRRG